MFTTKPSMSLFLSGDLETIDTISDFYNTTQVCGFSPSASLEAALNSASIDVGNHSEIMKSRAVLSTLAAGSAIEDPEKTKIAEYVVENLDSSFTLTIDISLLFASICGDFETLNMFINQIASLKETDTLNVYTEIPFSDINTLVLFEVVAISNIIKNAKCTTVFKFGSDISFSELIVASRCDKMSISDFAMLSIVSAESGQLVSRYLTGIVKDLVKTTYNYWAELGMITREEILGIYSDESEFSIFIMGSEMRSRINRIGKGIIV